MREIRQSGSEGGGNEQTVSPYPYRGIVKRVGSWGKKRESKESKRDQRSGLRKCECGMYCNHSRPKADSSIGMVIKGQLAG